MSESSSRPHFYTALLILTLLVAAICLILKLQSPTWSASEQEAAVSLTSSDSLPAGVALDPEYLATMGVPLASSTPFIQWVLQNIAIPEPPADDSAETEREIQALQAWVHARTPAQLTEIESEVNVTGFKFGSSRLDKLAAAKPKTGNLLNYANAALKPVVYRLKAQFNRTRPSALDKSLSTVVAVPGHPAYPSGHASQAYLFAHILTYLDPLSANAYFADAERIAKNREIAGLHYPSDSEAGRLLAGQLFLMLLAEPTFKSLLVEAEMEW